jgi:hypothetical protein
MDADWEVEVGGGAAAIDALWSGFVDLRSNVERIGEIPEAMAFPPLAVLLKALNAPASPLWTAKCDLWEPAPAEVVPGAEFVLACYIDMLPAGSKVFAEWKRAEAYCQDWVARLAPLPLANCNVELVVRLAVAGETEGFGVTAYLGASGTSKAGAADNLAAAMAAFSATIPGIGTPAAPASKLQ